MLLIDIIKKNSILNNETLKANNSDTFEARYERLSKLFSLLKNSGEH
jgi:hypothetical protein